MENIKSQNSRLNLPLKKIGNFIKEARLNRNQSVSELATDLKISMQQLRAIEDGREDLLPETIFVKAMIKRISERLKLDSSFIESELDKSEDEIKIEEIIEEVANSRELKDVKTTTFGFISLIIISGIIGYLSSSLLFNTLFDQKGDLDKKDLIRKN